MYGFILLPRPPPHVCLFELSSEIRSVAVKLRSNQATNLDVCRFLMAINLFQRRIIAIGCSARVEDFGKNGLRPFQLCIVYTSTEMTQSPTRRTKTGTGQRSFPPQPAKLDRVSTPKYLDCVFVYYKRFESIAEWIIGPQMDNRPSSWA